MHLSGRIIEEQKSYYLIDTEQGVIRSILKGVIKKKEKRLYVGDVVNIEVFNIDTHEGIIRNLHPRKNTLHKPAVTNIDQIILVNTLKEPAISLEFIDRFLFSCGVLDFPVIIAFNKIDLLKQEDRQAQSEIISWYEKIGYPWIEISALTGENIDGIIEHCKNTISIFAGQSGTGKSTILSKIFPEKSFRISELSENIKRGIHTTSNISLLKLAQDGYIADTPGFSFMDLPVVPEEEVVTFFPDIASEEGECKFANCIHENEPDCKIVEMVENGEIMESRYTNYLKIYHIMKRERKDYRSRDKKTPEFPPETNA